MRRSSCSDSSTCRERINRATSRQTLAAIAISAAEASDKSRLIFLEEVKVVFENEQIILLYFCIVE